MAKKSRKKSSQNKKILAFDLGGTKLLAAVISASGDIEALLKEPVQLKAGPSGLVQQMAEMGRRVSEGFKISKCAISSAGPLDPEAGKLLNPTNLKGSGKHWGVVPLASDLSRRLRMKVMLENDAACAALAEGWVGEARGCENFVAVTLGTGLGVGAVCNGELVRSGRGLHPEFGHITMDTSVEAPLCGCGNRGCAEAILSGVNFSKLLAARWGEPELTGVELVRRARSGNQKALSAFEDYGALLAKFMCSLAVVFSPEKIVISGGFSSAYDLFEKSLQRELLKLMATRRVGVDMLPEVAISSIHEYAGLYGAARITQ